MKSVKKLTKIFTISFLSDVSRWLFLCRGYRQDIPHTPTDSQALSDTIPS